MEELSGVTSASAGGHDGIEDLIGEIDLLLAATQVDVSPEFRRAVDVVEDFASADLRRDPVDGIFATLCAARTLVREGKLRIALAVGRRALKLAERYLPPAHGLTRQVSFELGDMLRQNGDFAEAETIIKQLLIEVKSIDSKSDERLNVVDCKNQLALILFSQQRYSESVKLAQEALDEGLVICPNDGFRISSMISNLAVASAYVHSTQQTRKTLERSIEILSLTEYDTNDFALAINNLGMCCVAEDDFQAARSHFERALKTLAPDKASPQFVALIKSNLGAILIKEDAQAAQEMLDQAHSLYVDAFGEDHPNALWTKRSLAGLAFEKGDIPEAILLTHEMLRLAQGRYGPEHVYVARIYEFQAQLFGRLQQHAEAKFASERAAEIRAHSEFADLKQPPSETFAKLCGFANFFGP